MTGTQLICTPCERELAEARLEVFIYSIFREYPGNGAAPRSAVVRRIFVWRLLREYRRFLREGLSPSRAAAAAMGRADNFLPEANGTKRVSRIFPAAVLPAASRTNKFTDISETVSCEKGEYLPDGISYENREKILPAAGKISENISRKMPEEQGGKGEKFQGKITPATHEISKEREDKEKMKNSLRVYVDSLFTGAPDTASVKELHDEILSNLEERYDDCIAGGMTPQRAYTAVVGTMGDIGKLIRQVSEEGQPPAGLFERSSPTGKGVFKKYSYIFTEKNLKIIKRTAIAVMWILLTAFYFLVSFNSDMWDRTWVIFLVGAGLNVAINMAGDIARFSRLGDNAESRVRILKAIQGSVSAILWLASTFMFIMIGMSDYFLFSRAWVIFILAAAVQVIINAVMKIQINRYKD